MAARIHLLRHGQPACLLRSGLSAQDYKSWVGAYDASRIVDLPPAWLEQWLAACDIRTVASSALPRAIALAKALVGDERIHISPLFNEAAVTFLPLPIRMTSSQWTAMGPLAWLCGGMAEEDAAYFRQRVRAAADELVRWSAKAPTLLVGHGWINRAIGRQLLARGFVIQRRTQAGFWSLTSFGSSAYARP